MIKFVVTIASLLAILNADEVSKNYEIEEHVTILNVENF